MNTRKAQLQVVQQQQSALAALSLRLREAGIVLISCGLSGDLISSGTRSDDWLLDLFRSSPLFRSHLVQAAASWTASDEPASVQTMPGVWLVPMPVTNRRRRAGYSVAIILSAPFLEAEQLNALCQSAQMDSQFCRTRLTELGLIAESDIDRLALLVRSAHIDQLKLTSNTQAAESVGKQLAESYEEMNLLYTIIQSMTVQERPERFVAFACQELLATLPYTWIGAQFNDNRDRLKSLSGRLILAGDPGQPAATLRNVARTLIEQAQPGEAIVLEPNRNPEQSSFMILGKTVVAQPVTSNGEIVGLLIAGDKRPDVSGDTAASSVDIKLLGATATHMAIFLENAALYDDLQAMFLGTLEALTASIDAKDRYTCGHSRRVAHLTQELARAIRLDEHTVGRMHIAGLVHDVGKIGVPETVLLKPGKLNVDEFAWIRKHPEIGFRILKDIPQLSDILPGVLHHHERWDGLGYPEGLRGEGIPLVARLIALWLIHSTR